MSDFLAQAEALEAEAARLRAKAKEYETAAAHLRRAEQVIGVPSRAKPLRTGTAHGTVSGMTEGQLRAIRGKSGSAKRLDLHPVQAAVLARKEFPQTVPELARALSHDERLGRAVSIETARNWCKPGSTRRTPQDVAEAIQRLIGLAPTAANYPNGLKAARTGD